MVVYRKRKAQKFKSPENRREQKADCLGGKGGEQKGK